MLHKIPFNRLRAVSSNGSLNASSCANGCMITLDSGLPYIAGPSEEITTLQDFIGAKKDSSGDVRMVLFVSYTLALISLVVYY